MITVITINEETLLAAKNGDEEAIAGIFEMYKLMIHRRSFVNGVFDEDLMQILVQVLLNCIDTFQI